MIKTNQRSGANFGNINPKFRKRQVTLRWSFNKIETRSKSGEKSLSNSPLKRRFYKGNRFASNSIRFS